MNPTHYGHQNVPRHGLGGSQVNTGFDKSHVYHMYIPVFLSFSTQCHQMIAVPLSGPVLISHVRVCVRMCGDIVCM